MRQAACCVKVALRNQKLTWLLMMSCRNGSAQAPAVRDATGQIGTVPRDVQFCTNFGDSNPLALSVEVN
jgi:hypothetical protein